MIKYQYALDVNDNLINIETLERNNLNKNSKFYTVDYKQELIPRLGKINRKHFALKSKDNNSSKETYLHALAKKVFFDLYSECLETKKPFLMGFYKHQICTRLKEIYNLECDLKNTVDKFDLTSRFTEIKVEKKVDGVIPDILLIDPKKGNKIYIEIAVTHYSDEPKIKLGHRIIEFTISSEKDISFLKEFKNRKISPIVKYFNFNLKKEVKSICRYGRCIYEFMFFGITNNGKAILRSLKEYDVEAEKEDYPLKYRWYNIEPFLFNTGHDYDDDYSFGDEMDYSNYFKYYLSVAVQNNIKVKNCFLCRYHADNNLKRSTKQEPIFCKYLKIKCKSNYASECKSFRLGLDYVAKYNSYNLLK